jgi:hypothetical protein
MSRSTRRLMLWIALPASAYAALVLLVYLMQERLIFVGAAWGRGARVDAPAGVAVERLDLPTGGSFRVAVGEPAGTPRGVMVFFVGNGEDLRSGVHWAALWAGYELASVVVEYPGYGDSDGSPGVEQFLAAAEVAAAFGGERARAIGGPLLAGGTSLGSFPAVHLAATGRADRLFLRAPPSTLEAAARRHYPWLPVGWLLRHRFDNLARAGLVRCPTFVLHGDRDSIVPMALGAELARAFAGPCEFVAAEGYDHNDLPCHASGPFGRRIAAFLRRP